MHNTRFMCRGKAVGSDEWVEGFLFAYRESHFILPTESKDSQHTYLFDYAVEVHSATLGQCTGLQDKNGVMIFEGDIVKYERAYKNHRGIYQVVYDEYGFNCEGFGDSGYDYPGIAFSEGSEVFEIIGNVHENSDLLKGGD